MYNMRIKRINGSSTWLRMILDSEQKFNYDFIMACEYMFKTLNGQ